MERQYRLQVIVALLVVAVAACGKEKLSAPDASDELGAIGDARSSSPPAPPIAAPARAWVEGAAHASRRVESCLPTSMHDAKACASDEDCVIVDVIASCCGTVHAMGVSKRQAAPVMACRPKNRGEIAPCGCAQDSPFTDDRFRPAGSEQTPRVTCAVIDDGSRECRTYWAAGWPPK